VTHRWKPCFLPALCGLVLAPLSAALAGDAKAPKDMASTPVIARDVLFGNPDKANPQISPDGTQLAHLAEVDGVMNVWVGPVDKPEAARAVTQDRQRGIRNYQWTYHRDLLLYTQDKDGDENWHVYATDVRSQKTTDLTPLKGVQARIVQVSHKRPGEVLLAINDRKAELHDVYLVDLKTGERKRVVENTGYLGFVADDDLKVRLAMRVTPDGGSELFKLTPGGDWSLCGSIPAEDMLTTQPVGFDAGGKNVLMVDSRGRDTGALFLWNPEDGGKKQLAADPRCDLDDVLQHPTRKSAQAVSFTYDRKKWQVLDPSIQADMDYLATVCGGDAEVGSRTLDDARWIVSYVVDNGPVRFYLYDRPAKKARFLFTNRSRLEGLPLARMHPVVIRSRDGMNLVSYLSLPAWTDGDADGRPDRPLPMVLLVHGGPWGRDDWGLNPMHQWLANRGYAVLSVNFRSSTGMGKRFVNAGNGEWAGNMHNDLLDAVEWAVDGRIAERAKVAIMGGSYGGYATLVGLTFTPEVFACGVDIVGPSNIATLLASIPPYWKPMRDMFHSRVGNPETEEGRRLLQERSPLTHVAKIRRPLLIGQGANDPRVKQAESDQIVKAMKDRNIPVTYVLYPDEGHGFRRPENGKSFNAVIEAFLAQHLGGRSEPVGDDFRGSTIQVPEGADQVPGLAEALKKS
jgi:dipeptidyl aminopeptidase/acylaminoacyl peptidase